MPSTLKPAPQQARKTALITGASSGIGRALAERFAQNGCNLVLVARNQAALARLAEEWQSRYRITVTVIPADLSVEGAAQSVFDAVATRGIEIDYLVNNAGYGLFGESRHLDLEAELAMMTLNMTALTVLTKRFLPQLLARRGKVMNVASTAAFQPGPYMAVYYATKAYVLSYSEALAAELGDSGVTVTAFCPGPTASGFQDKAAMHDSGLVKGKRLPSAESVAAVGFRAMLAGERVYVPGLMNKFLVQTVRFTPRRLVTSIVQSMSAPRQ